MKKKTLIFQNCLGVFQGGGCRGAAFVGAFREAIDRGVSFSEVAGTSAGSIVAAFIAAGATPDQLQDIIGRLDFRSLLGAPTGIDGFKASLASKLVITYNKDIYKVITSAGLHSSDKLKDWIDRELKKLLNKTTSVKFSDLIIPTTIIVTDLKEKKVKLHGSLHDGEEYVAEAVRRSCNIPIYFQPIEKRFVDGGLLSNLPSFVFKNQQNSTYEKVLAFSLSSEDTLESTFNDITSYISTLASTAIDGSMDVQLALQKNVHIISIPTGDIKATDFNKITSQNIAKLIDNGKLATSDFFEEEIANLKAQYERPDIIFDPFKAYNEIVIASSSQMKEVIFSDYDTAWLYELFPTLLKWIQKNTKITVIVKENNDNPHVHGLYRQKLLASLGCEVIRQTDLPMRGIIINGKHIDTARALVYSDLKSEEGTYHSKLYHGDADFKVISLLREHCLRCSNSTHTPVDLIVQPIADRLLFKNLHSVKQYPEDGVSFEVRDVNIENLTFITRYIRGFKYRQIDSLFNLFNANNVAIFSPAKLTWPDNKFSVITPPIIEEVGNRLFVIEGNTRLTYAYKNGIKTIKAVVVKGVKDPFPSSGKFKVNEMLISDREVKGETRYNDWDYSLFRKIESAVRNPSESINFI